DRGAGGGGSGRPARPGRGPRPGGGDPPRPATGRDRRRAGRPIGRGGRARAGDRPPAKPTVVSECHPTAQKPVRPATGLGSVKSIAYDRISRAIGGSADGDDLATIKPTGRRE